VHVNASSPSSAPRHRRHDAKGILGKRMCMHLLPGTNSTYVMMTRGCMHAPLSIKKVMSMQCVCMHPLAIIIKKYLSTPSVGVWYSCWLSRCVTCAFPLFFMNFSLCFTMMINWSIILVIIKLLNIISSKEQSPSVADSTGYEHPFTIVSLLDLLLPQRFTT